MKYFVKIIVITYLLFGINSTFAEEKVVYVDMNKILTESKVGKFVEKELTTIHKGNLDNFKEMEEKIPNFRSPEKYISLRIENEIKESDQKYRLFVR